MSKNLQEKINNQFEILLKEGDDLSKLAQNSPRDFTSEETARVASWVTRTQQLLLSIMPGGGPYYKQMINIMEQKSKGGTFYILHSNHYTHFAVAVGCLKGAYEDFLAGQLVDIKALLQADIFTDFLEMAEHLLDQNYKDAAAVLIGAVLEDSLRKIAANNNLPLQNDKGKDKTIDPLNSDLAKAGIYDKLVQKQITT